MSIFDQFPSGEREEARLERIASAAVSTYIVGVDLGQQQDHTAISIVERVDHPLKEPAYLLRYLHRPALGTKYPAIVEQVLALLHRKPLTPDVPLIVDKTGVGAAVVDLFQARGKRAHAVTITGGEQVNRHDPYDLRVPKRDLAMTLVALFQTGRLQIASGLQLAPVLTNELVNFKVKVNIATGHDSYEAWRESVHDDLVLSVAMACWWGEYEGSAGVWLV